MSGKLPEKEWQEAVATHSDSSPLDLKAQPIRGDGSSNRSAQEDVKDERMVDIYQDEIIRRFTDYNSFKKFALSSRGLRLDPYDVQTIEENIRVVENRKMKFLWKWQEREGRNATPQKIRAIVENYFRRN